MLGHKGFGVGAGMQNRAKNLSVEERCDYFKNYTD